MQNSESVVVHSSLTLKIGYKCNQEDRRQKKTWLILHVESVCLVSTDDPKNNKRKNSSRQGKRLQGGVRSLLNWGNRVFISGWLESWPNKVNNAEVQTTLAVLKQTRNGDVRKQRRPVEETNSLPARSRQEKQSSDQNAVIHKVSYLNSWALPYFSASDAEHSLTIWQFKGNF